MKTPQVLQDSFRVQNRSILLSSLLVVLLLGAGLYFFAERQQRVAERNRIRLLASLAQRIETRVEGMGERFARRVAQGEGALGLRRSLEQVEDFRVLDEALRGEIEPEAGAGITSVALEARDARFYLTYRGADPVAEATGADGDSGAAAETGGEGDGDGDGASPGGSEAETGVGLVEPTAREFRHSGIGAVSVEILLEPLVRPMILPGVFDSILLVRADGEVLFQAGEPQYRMTSAEGLLRQARASPPPEGSEKEAGDPVSAVRPRVFLGDVAAREQRIFVQPLRVRLPRFVGDDLPPPTRWVVFGLVPRDRLFAAGFTGAPTLLVTLLAIVPVSFVVWPFLKLALIGPRQRFTRFDAAALVLSGLMGVSLLTFLVLGLEARARLWGSARADLQKVGKAIEKNFRAELLEAGEQLELLVPTLAGPKENEEEDYDRLVLASLADASLPPSKRYPAFADLATFDSEGEELEKVAPRPGGRLEAQAQGRFYLRCALRGRQAGDPREPADYCPEALRSRTTGTSLVTLAVPGPDAAAGEYPTVFTSSYRPLSLLAAPVPSEVGFAILAPDGRVLLHSDERRNLSENFLKASDEDAELESVLLRGREGYLSTRYWGQPHLLWVSPLDGLPWTLVTFQDVGLLQAKLLDVAHDLFNGYVVFLFPFQLAFFLLLWLYRGRDRQVLWPDPARTMLYYALSALTVLFSGLAAAALTWGGRGWVLATLLFSPFAVFACGILVLAIRPSPDRWDDDRAEVGKRRVFEHAVLGILAVSLSWWALGGLLGTCLFVALAVLYLFSGSPSQVERWALAATFVEKWPRALVFARQALGTVVFALLVAALYLDRERWGGKILLLIIFLAIGLSWPWVRRDFFGDRRRRSYLFALRCVIVLLAALPALLLFELVTDRQTEIYVGDLQHRLAVAVERSRARLDGWRYDPRSFGEEAWQKAWKERSEEWNRPCGLFEAWRKEQLARQEPVLASFRETELAPEAVTCEERPVFGRSPWRIFAWRPLPIQEISADRLGFDLSRFHDPLLCTQSTEEGFVFEARPADGSTGAVLLRSQAVLGTTAPLTWPALAAGGVGFLLACGGFSVFTRFFARYILLDDLVGRDRGDTFGAIRQSLRVGDRLLLVSALPEITRDEFIRAAVGSRRPEGVRAVHVEILRPDTESLESAAAMVRGLEKGLDHKALVLVSARESGRLLQQIRDRVAERRGDAQIVDLWSSFLGTLTLRYGRQDTREEPEATRMSHLARFEEGLEAALRDELSASSNSPPQELGAPSPPLPLASPPPEELTGIVHRLLDRAVSQSFGEHEGVLAPGVLSTRHEDELHTVLAKIIRQIAGSEDGRRAGLTPACAADLVRVLRVVVDECYRTRFLQRLAVQVVHQIDPVSFSADKIVGNIGQMAKGYYRAIWSQLALQQQVTLLRLAEDGMVNPKNVHHVHELMLRGLVRRDPLLRLMNESFRRFVMRPQHRAELEQWVREEGLTAWSVLRWLLPIPLLLLGGYLYITQRETFSNVLGLLVALASSGPILYNLLEQLHRRSAAQREEPETKPA